MNGRLRGGVGLALGLVALAASGALLATWPHLVRLARGGDGSYLADGDQVLYMAWSRSALLEGSWRLTDAVHPKAGPMMHPWALFVPLARLARGLGLGTRGLAVVWRVIGGAGVALGIFAAVRPAVGDRRLALGLSAFLLFDAGFLFGTPLLREAQTLAEMARTPGGGPFDTVPRVMAHLRVVPPSVVVLPLLLLHLGLLVRARGPGGSRPAIAAGVVLGALFHVYFYFWTMATAALGLAFLADPGGRRAYVKAGLVGVLIGLPAIALNARVKASTPPDWLLRTDKFVPIGRLDEVLVPRVVIGLLAAAAFPVFRRRRELVPLWCAAVSGVLLMNHQVITRLQIENFHWQNGFGPVTSVLAAALVAPSLLGRRGALAAVVVAQAGLGLYLRSEEALRTSQTARWERVAERLDADDPPVPPGAVLAGDPDGVMLTAGLRVAYPLAGKLVEYSSGVTDAELDERLMLNLYLLGLGRDAARAEVARPAGSLSWEAQATREPSVARAQRERRLALIDRIWTDPAPFASRFGVSHVLLRADAPSPMRPLVAVGPASRLSLGTYWQLWKIGPTPGAAASSDR